jgi:hypothetical protein
MGEAIADIAALADQPVLHGLVASPATVWRVLAGVDATGLADLRRTRAVARDVHGWPAPGRAGQTSPAAVGTAYP